MALVRRTGRRSGTKTASSSPAQQRYGRPRRRRGGRLVKRRVSPRPRRGRHRHRPARGEPAGRPRLPRYAPPAAVPRARSSICTACPDLGPVLFAAAARAHGAVFTGTRRLRIKESDRVAAMAQELAKLGVRVDAEENRVTVHPGGIAAPRRSARRPQRSPDRHGAERCWPPPSAAPSAVPKPWPRATPTFSRCCRPSASGRRSAPEHNNFPPAREAAIERNDHP